MAFPKHDRAAKNALADVGVTEHPLGSNSGARVQTYQHATWLPGTRWPWCVAFLQYHWKLAGLEMPWRGAGAYALLDWAKQHGWDVPLAQAIPGDAVVFNIGAGHAGMFLGRAESGHVHTVDGNVDDQVAQRVRENALVRGCVHIPEVAVTPPPAKAPILEVVTSVNGHKKVVFVGRRKAVAHWLDTHPIFAKYAQITIRRRDANV